MSDENNFLPNDDMMDDTSAVSEKNEEVSFALPSRKLNPQVLLLIGIVGIGGGMLWGMRYFGTRSGMDWTGQTDVNFVPPPTGMRMENEQRIMHDLEMSDKLVQLPSDDIQRNPFTSQRTREAAPNIPDDSLGRAEMARLARERAERERKLQDITDQASKMTVSSIMLGSRPVAVVNGTPVTVGNTVENVFKVERIEDRIVIIAAEGLQFRLSMDKDQ